MYTKFKRSLLRSLVEETLNSRRDKYNLHIMRSFYAFNRSGCDSLHLRLQLTCIRVSCRIRLGYSELYKRFRKKESGPASVPHPAIRIEGLTNLKAGMHVTFRLQSCMIRYVWQIRLMQNTRLHYSCFHSLFCSVFPKTPWMKHCWLW
jgi:hypothetical protein